MHHDFDSLGVTFYPVVVIGLGKNLLFISVLAHCDIGKIYGGDFEKICGLLRIYEL